MPAKRETLVDLLARALPYVEEAINDPCNKPAPVRELARKIRAAGRLGNSLMGKLLGE